MIRKKTYRIFSGPALVGLPGPPHSNMCPASETSRDAVKITCTVWPWNWAKAAFAKRCRVASSGGAACWKFLNATVIQIFFFSFYILCLDVVCFLLRRNNALESVFRTVFHFLMFSILSCHSSIVAFQEVLLLMNHMSRCWRGPALWRHRFFFFFGTSWLLLIPIILLVL